MGKENNPYQIRNTGNYSLKIKSSLTSFFFHLIMNSLTKLDHFHMIECMSLTHESTKSVKCSRNSGLGVNFYQDIFLCVYINLEKSCSVQWTVHQHQQTLKIVKKKFKKNYMYMKRRKCKLHNWKKFPLSINKVFNIIFLKNAAIKCVKIPFFPSHL